MASGNLSPKHRTLHPSNTINPNETPYNSVSTFKYFDDTVVSAYEVGIKKTDQKKIVRTRNQSLPPKGRNTTNVKSEFIIRNLSETKKKLLSQKDENGGSHEANEIPKNGYVKRDDKKLAHIKNRVPRNQCGEVNVTTKDGTTLQGKQLFSGPVLNKAADKTKETIDPSIASESIIETVDSCFNFLSKTDVGERLPRKSADDDLEIVPSSNASHANLQNLNQSRADKTSTTEKSRHSCLPTYKTSVRENDSVSPNHRRLVLPGNDDKPVVTNRRKLPKIPSQRSSVTKLANNSQLGSMEKEVKTDKPDNLLNNYDDVKDNDASLSSTVDNLDKTEDEDSAFSLDNGSTGTVNNTEGGVKCKTKPKQTMSEASVDIVKEDSGSLVEMPDNLKGGGSSHGDIIRPPEQFGNYLETVNSKFKTKFALKMTSADLEELACGNVKGAANYKKGFNVAQDSAKAQDSTKQKTDGKFGTTDIAKGITGISESALKDVVCKSSSSCHEKDVKGEEQAKLSLTKESAKSGDSSVEDVTKEADITRFDSKTSSSNDSDIDACLTDYDSSSTGLVNHGANYDIENVLDDIVNRAADKLTENIQHSVVFTFDKSVIQELTDSVMGKDSAISGNDTEKITQGVKSEIESNANKKSCTKHDEKGRNNLLTVVRNGGLGNVQQGKRSSNIEKVSIEGKTCNGKEEVKNELPSLDSKTNSNNDIVSDINRVNKLTGDSKSNLGDERETRDKISDVDAKTNSFDKKLSGDSISAAMGGHTGQQKVKVERTPSYRRRVMARAKTRYSKKSKTLKECSCVRKENGNIDMCQFCQNYATLKQRSQTSLGNVTLNKTSDEMSDSDFSEISSPRRAFTPGLPPLPGQSPKAGHFGSPKSLRKVQVSPRVDVLLSSDLFKKHLEKHENLLIKHTKSYRRFGLKKSVSNLDLSEGFVLDSDQSQCDNESEAGDRNFDSDTNDYPVSMSHDLSSSNQKPRRYSLTGESDSSVEMFFKKQERKKKQTFGTLPKSYSRSRPPIPSFNDHRSVPPSHYPIPSFSEFRKRKEQNGALNRSVSDNAFNTSPVCDQEAVSENEKSKENDSDWAKLSEERMNSPVSKLDLQTIEEVDNKGSKEDLINNTQMNDPNDLGRHTTTGNEKGTSQVANEAHFVDKLANTRSDMLQARNPLIRQGSAPDVREKRRQRIRPKLKSRTLSRLNMDAEGHYLSAGENSDTGGISPRNSLNEKHRSGAKRPRSVISIKSNLISLTQESDMNYNSNITETTPSVRPKLRVGSIINRSKSDSKYETDKGKNSVEVIEATFKGDHSRHLSLIGIGNCVSFDVDEVSQCSTQDVGESETSTSVAGSTLSDSLRSEVITDDTGQLLYDLDDSDSEMAERSHLMKEETMPQVLRSTSDACEITPEAARKRRERKERPYKSDPFSGTEIIPASKRYILREERARLRQQRSSKEDILTFLDGVSLGDLQNGESFPSLDELNEDDEQNLSLSDLTSESARKLRKNLSNVSSLSTDSGVIGQEGSHDSQHSSPSNTLSHSMSAYQMTSWQQGDKSRSFSASCSDLTNQPQENCVDCGHVEKYEMMRLVQICPQCYKRRIERKKTIQEIIDTEMNYGRDLSILKEEFCIPIIKAGLLNQEQLDSIFLNLEELIHVHKYFITKIKSSINSANQCNDEDMQTVMIGSLFLESSTMFLTFENYCVNQAQAPVLLEQLEKEKQLLRIFLHVSQNDNTLLRRMHLKSFLMVPVQRIMKYPLLLDRLYKATPLHHGDKESIKEAKEKIEDILGHINAKSKTTTIVKQRRLSEKHYSVTEKMEMSRVALETLHWNRKDVCDVITSRLQITQPLDHMWAVKKCKNYKFQNVHGVLLSLVQPSYEGENNVQNNTNSNTNHNNNNNNTLVQHAAVVFMKEKNGKYQVIREPFLLDKCVVSQDPDFMDVFEIIEWNKESYLIKADNAEETKSWVQHLRRQMNNLGCWRKRRNALPNILLNHLA